MKKESKNIAFLTLFIVSILGLSFFGIISVSPYAHAVDPNAYISGTDIIKNFRVREFDGESIIGKTIPSKDGKVYFESGPEWRAYKDDLSSVQVWTIGNQCVFKYELTFTNFINIYTNYLISDASELPIVKVTDNIYAGTFEHRGVLWNALLPDLFVLDEWTYRIKWDHYDFGNIINHNNDKVISGDVIMDFDIATSPLPDVYEDSFGNSISKDFDYIGVSSAYIYSNSYGKMSEDMPEIQGIVASEERKEMNHTTPESGAYPSGYTYEWDPEIQYSIYETIIVDNGIKPQTEFTSMNPTQRNGVLAWDARDKGMSMVDCEFSYTVPRLSPIIYGWEGLLQYKEIDLYVKETIGAGVSVTFSDMDNSKVGDVAIHLINRYIQSLMKLKFNIWSSFTFDLGVDQEFLLAQPQEYYDELLWTSIVYGFGGGIVHVEDPYPELAGVGIITIIIILIIVCVVIYVSYKLGKSYLRGRSGMY